MSYEERAKGIAFERAYQRRKAYSIMRALVDGTDPEAAEPHKQRSNRIEAARTIYAAMEAERRAKAKANAPTSLGLIVVVPQVPAAKWEQMAAHGAVIDVPALPAKGSDADAIGVRQGLQDGGAIHAADAARPPADAGPAAGERGGAGADSATAGADGVRVERVAAGTAAKEDAKGPVKG